MEGMNSKVLAFVCSHCSLSGAEAAGISRLQYPADLRIIQVACSGQIDETLIIDAFKRGIDGIMIFACPDGDCHYKIGNQIAKQRVKMLQAALRAVGLGAERLKFIQIGASEGEKFAEAVNQFFDELKQLGANPITKEEATL